MYSFDTGPIFLYFAGDARVRKFFVEMKRHLAEGCTCETNLAELYYKTCEQLGRDTARLRYISARKSELIIVTPDEDLTRSAGELKCRHRGKLSLADAYVIALSIRQGSDLITTDPRISQLDIVPTHLLELPEHRPDDAS